MNMKKKQKVPLSRRDSARCCCKTFLHRTRQVQTKVYNYHVSNIAYILYLVLLLKLFLVSYYVLEWPSTDQHHWQAPWPPRLKIKVAKSRGPSYRCWPISQEQNVPEKLVGRLPTRRAIMRTRFEVKRSKVKVIRLISVETESLSPTNFKLCRWLVHALSTAMVSYKGLWVDSLVLVFGSYSLQLLFCWMTFR